MFNVKTWCWSLGFTFSVSFAICVVWGLVTPEPLHMHAFWELVLPGFKWLTPLTFLLGLAESFLYGVYAGLVFVPLHNFFWRRQAETGGSRSDGR